VQPVDTPFLVLLEVTALVAVVAAIVYSPRLTGSPGRVIGRIALHLVAHALVVAVVAASVNAALGFYTTWSSLNPGNDPAGTSTQVAGDPGDALKATPTGSASASTPTAPAVLPPLPAPGQRLQTFQVAGATSGVTREVLVLLPTGYDPSDRTRSYPVIVALHGGYPADASHWIRHMEIQSKLDESVAARTIAPSIVVMPTMNTAAIGDGECVDGGVKGPALETFVAKDLVAWVRGHLRVTGDRAGWNTFGYSSGGYCATMFALHHPGTFASAVSFDGYLKPDFSGPYQPFGPGSEQWRRYDLVDYLRSATTPPPVALWFQREDLSAGVDASGKSEVQRLIDAARPPTSITLFDQPGVGHRTVVWRDGQPTAFEWLGRTSPAFAPSR